MFSPPVTWQEASSSEDCLDCPVLRVETNQTEHQRDKLLHQAGVLLYRETNKQRMNWKDPLASGHNKLTCFYEGENDQDLRENEW